MRTQWWIVAEEIVRLSPTPLIQSTSCFLFYGIWLYACLHSGRLDEGWEKRLCLMICASCCSGLLLLGSQEQTLFPSLSELWSLIHLSTTLWMLAYCQDEELAAVRAVCSHIWALEHLPFLAAENLLSHWTSRHGLPLRLLLRERHFVVLSFLHLKNAVDVLSGVLVLLVRVVRCPVLHDGSRLLRTSEPGLRLGLVHCSHLCGLRRFSNLNLPELIS